MKAMMIELGCKPELDVVRIHADSAVARSFVATRGPGGNEAPRCTAALAARVCTTGEASRDQG